jgi:hypothetical protein
MFDSLGSQHIAKTECSVQLVPTACLLVLIFHLTFMLLAKPKISLFFSYKIILSASSKMLCNASVMA